jgi:hypothetical protein
MPGLVIILFFEEKKVPKKKLCVDCLRTMCCYANRRASNLPQKLGQRLTAIVVVSISDRSIDPPIYHMCWRRTQLCRFDIILVENVLSWAVSISIGDL